jgi:hypothetical protein
MSGHLKAEDFTNALEGIALSSRRQAHLDGCGDCAATLQALSSAHAAVANRDVEIPEPDWHEFHSSVREELLSRSIQRQSAVRRWTGWHVRPAAAWAFSLVLAVSVTAGGFLWHMNNVQPAPLPVVAIETAPAVSMAPPVTAVAPEAVVELTAIDDELAVWSNPGIFDQITELDAASEAQFRILLEAVQTEVAQEQ